MFYPNRCQVLKPCSLIKAMASFYLNERRYYARTHNENGQPTPRPDAECRRWHKIFRGYAETLIHFATIACLGEARYACVKLQGGSLRAWREGHLPTLGLPPYYIEGQMVEYSGGDPKLPMFLSLMKQILPMRMIRGEGIMEEARSKVYAYQVPTPAQRPVLELCDFVFSKFRWKGNGNYGGKAWAECAKKALNLGLALDHDVDTGLLILVTDRLINAVHNGGNLFSKFGCGHTVNSQQVLELHHEGSEHELKKIEEGKGCRQEYTTCACGDRFGQRYLPAIWREIDAVLETLRETSAVRERRVSPGLDLVFG